MSEEEQAGASKPTTIFARLSTLPRLAKALLALSALSLILGLAIRLSAAKPSPASGPLGPVRFTLIVTRARFAGGDKLQVLGNGSSPGPTLRVPLGREVEVTVINQMATSTVVHWHGMGMQGTPGADGVPGTTQCPIPSAASFVYRFTPDRAGTFWWHGHFASDWTDGLFGALIVDDGGAVMAAAAAAASAASPVGFDEDSWIWAVSDWYNVPGEELLPGYLSPASGGNEPQPDAILVNGLRSGDLAYTTPRATRQLVRVINVAVFSMWNVSVDGLPLSVVELDGTAVSPFDAPFVILNVAQRAAFVLDWSRVHPDLAASPALRFRVSAMPEMYPTFDYTAPDDGLFGTASGEPFALEWSGQILFQAGAAPSYADPPALSLSPVAETNALAARSFPPSPAPPLTLRLYAEIVFQADALGINRAFFNNATYPMATAAQLAAPLLYAYGSAAGGPQASSPASLAATATAPGAVTGDAVTPFILPLGAVVEVLVNNTDTGEHPLHLHGHTVWVVATSASPDAESLYGPHFVRRDVVSVPAGGWARFRFVANNPGVWLFHCHIEWHMLAGLMTTFVEAPEQLLGSLVVAPDQAAACSAAALLAGAPSPPSQGG